MLRITNQSFHTISDRKSQIYPFLGLVDKDTAEYLTGVMLDIQAINFLTKTRKYYFFLYPCTMPKFAYFPQSNEIKHTKSTFHEILI